MSSHDVVRHFKHNLPFKPKKIGHLGTLDPFACGVLIIACNGAAKISDYVHSMLPKTYLGIGKLGIKSNTGDRTGDELIPDNSDYFQQIEKHIDKKKIEELLQMKFLGDYEQIPPQFSATKFQGKRLYQWAREGVFIPKEAVKRHIYNIEVVKYQHPYVSFRTTVSSGTYIRTLFSDIAESLGTSGTLFGLVRESVGHIHCQDALRKSQWPNKNCDLKDGKWRPQLEEVLTFPIVTMGPKLVEDFGHGRAISWQSEWESLKPSNNSFIWLKDNNGRLLGLAEVKDSIISSRINYSL